MAGPREAVMLVCCSRKLSAMGFPLRAFISLSWAASFALSVLSFCIFLANTALPRASTGLMMVSFCQ